MHRFIRSGGRSWLAILAAFAVAGCSRPGPEEPEGHEGHDHAAPGGAPEDDGHAGHAHEAADAEGGSPGTLSDEEILAARCEHEVPTHACDECRYEVGVVRVTDELIEGRASNGLLRLVRPTEEASAEVLRLHGEIRLNENRAVHVTPRLSGVIRRVHADLGQRVREGDLLLELDSVDLGQAIADFRKNLALEDLAGRAHERERALWEKRVGAEADVMEAEGKREEVRTARRAAEQRLHVLGLTARDVAGVRADAPETLRGTLPLRAAQDGIILERHATAGEAVGPERELMLLADLSELWAWVDVFDRDLATLTAAHAAGPAPVEVRVRAWPEAVFTGRLDRIGSVMDEATRTVKARVTVANPDGRLRPGMFCEAAVRGAATARRALMLPREAVLADEGRTFVFVPLTNGYFRRKDVTCGRERGGAVEVAAGLSAADTVVAQGAFMLKSDVLRAKMGAGCAD